MNKSLTIVKTFEEREIRSRNNMGSNVKLSVCDESGKERKQGGGRISSFL